MTDEVRPRQLTQGACAAKIRVSRWVKSQQSGPSTYMWCNWVTGLWVALVPCTPDDLEQVYRTARRQLRAVATRLVPPQDADDFVHDAFVHALKAKRHLREECTATRWVYRIVVNARLTARARAKRRPFVSSVDDAHVGRLVPKAIEMRAVGQALACVSADERVVCILYDVLGFTHREIATALAIPVGTSKSRLCVARSRMRTLLSKQPLA